MSNLAESINYSLTPEQALTLRSMIEKGLPLVKQPYLALANAIGASEAAVINCIESWQQSGLIKRFGMVVKHRQLGYVANAMVVWNIPDADVDSIAKKLAKEADVTLCYRRPRVLPHWPYNLFCMVHGKCRQQVEAAVSDIASRLNLEHIDKHLLFSTKAYKQQGARYLKQTKREQN